MQDRLLNPQEAANYLKLDCQEFLKLVDKYKIPHYRIAGKFLRFSLQELIRFKEMLEKDLISQYQGAKEINKINELTISEKVKEFLKFYDFYIVSFILILVLLYYIIFY